MNFPITVMCFDKRHRLICNPTIISKNCLFTAPFSTKYVVEVSSEILNYFSFERQNMFINKKIKVFQSHFLKSKRHLL